MSRNISSLALLERVQAGEPASIARMISRAEGGKPEAREALARIYKLAGRAHVIGITGVPGSGKSTLVGKLTEKLREKGGKVGIVAIDPSSPYSGGAILGDRVRMTDAANDPGVYIRSMATRGAVGGMARATLDAVDILDVAGYDTVVVETVGVGQDEVEIVRASHTTVVVSAPGLGDEIQAIKAGILEIADIHVVSKCDRSDANRTLVDLKQMLMLGMGKEKPEWTIPVVGTSALNGAGPRPPDRGDRRASQDRIRQRNRPPAAPRDCEFSPAQDGGKSLARALRQNHRPRWRARRQIGAARGRPLFARGRNVRVFVPGRKSS